MVNYNKFKEYIIDNILNKTIFLAKSIDEVESLLKYWNLNQKNIIAVRTSKKMKQKYKDIYVYELESKEREVSTQNFFRKYLFASGLFNKLIKSVFSKYDLSLWMFRSYEWCKDLEQINNIKVLLIDHNLYLKLNNKILILKMFENSDYLSYHLQIRNNALKTVYDFNTLSIYDKLIKNYPLPWVVSSQTSDGGNGVFKIENFDDFKFALSHINNPIIKIEKFIEDCISVSQHAIIFHDKIIKYQPSLQIIEENNKNLKFMGANYKLAMDDKIKKKLTKLTHFIGNELKKLGYKGIFGCDYIVKDGEVYFTEINPRFQGSTFLLTYNNDVFNPYIMHILSFLYSKEIIEFKNSIDICENQYIELKSDYYKYKYIFNKEEIKTQHKNKEFRIPFDDIIIKPEAPLGFYIE